MEDAVSIRPDFLHDGGVSSSSGKHHFFGVFDSHGCCHVCVRLASAVIRSSPPRFPSLSPFPCARSNLACLCASLQTRYVMKYRHNEGELVLKVTDDREVPRVTCSL
jgi:serine/threonine protein phosphatase PrpC